MPAIVQELAKEQTSPKTKAGWTLTRVWQVTVEAVEWASIAAVEAVMNASNGAQIGDAHPIKRYAFLKLLDPKVRAGNRLIWDVTGTYEERPNRQPDEAENPLEEPTTLSWSSEARSVAESKDKDGKAIVNSAGQQFDPPLTGDRHTLVATLKYNSAVFNPVLGVDFQDAVNEAATTVGNVNINPRQGKILEIGSDERFFEDLIYWEVTIKVGLRRETWDRVVMDMGIYGLDDDGKIVRLITEDGEEVTEPLKLNGSGKVLDPQTAPAVFRTFRVAKEKNFSVLNLSTL